MSTVTERALDRLVTRARTDPGILAVIQFGSQARGEASIESDLDVCLVLGDEPRRDPEAGYQRLAYFADDRLDVSIFQHLPLHVRRRILKEGTVRFVRDEDALYALAVRTARAFEAFRHIQRRYLDQVLHDRP
ncbi:MAG: nucleotidyltransferase domain-containing protein [Candidatus Rokuibacteriota bacterium]